MNKTQYGAIENYKLDFQDGVKAFTDTMRYYIEHINNECDNKSCKTCRLLDDKLNDIRLSFDESFYILSNYLNKLRK